MKKFLIFAVALLALAGCSKGSGEQGTNSENIVVDTIYNSKATEQLLEKNGSDKALTQADYAAMIEQCRAINRILADKLMAVDFKEDMSDEEIARAMAELQNDKDIPMLERQSRELLVALQNADLDEGNVARYDRMVRDAEAALRRL